MVSLWGSKNGEEHEPQSEDHEDGADETPSSHHRAPERREPDERSRLLPPGHNGFLDPDDPAVTPYNLWSVRALRFFMIAFLFITFLWWILLLVSIFVSPPMMHSRGSGFFDFSYTTLTAGNIILAVIFFTTPSKATQISSWIVTIFLLIDVIIISAVERLRIEEGWVGIASVVWAALISLYTVAADRTVAWGKKSEEERLTGRRETRRSCREWCAILTSQVGMIVLIVIVFLLTCTLILRSSDASLEPPGNRYYVDGAKYQIHLACEGNVTYGVDGKRSPTVIVEAAEGPVEDTFEDWIFDAHQNGTIDRYCYYDRPGIAWSDNAPSPHSAGMTTTSLLEALIAAGEQGPWVVVAGGIGGIYGRIFSSREDGNIHALMLVDSLHEDLLSRVASPGRGFLLWAYGIISPLGWDRLPGAIFAGRTREDRTYGRSANQGGKYIKAKLQENLVADSLTHSEVIQARQIQDRKTPLVVISSGVSNRKDSEWEEKQKDLTTLTDNLIAWDVVNGAPHEVWKTFEGRKILEKRLGELVRGN